MEYQQLGGAGIRISRLVLGCISFGESVDLSGASEIVASAVDRGITTFDTSDFYAQGRSETLLGGVLKSRRDKVVICTKVGLRVGDTTADLSFGRPHVYDIAERMTRGITPNEHGASRVHIMHACEASLRRLDTDYIDLYQTHDWDPTTPIEETLSALDSLLRQGKIRYIGCSAYTSWQLYKALWTSDLRRYVRLSSIQLPYSLLTREVESDLLPACEEESIAVLAYQAMAGGLLAGAYTAAPAPPSGSHLSRRPNFLRQFWNPQTFARISLLSQFAEDKGVTLAQLATAWVLNQRSVTGVLIGVETADQLGEVCGAADVILQPNDLKRISDIMDHGTANQEES